MVGYALYYSSFTISEVSSAVAQSEAISINRAPKSDVEIATTQVIRIDAVNISRSNLTREERWNEAITQIVLPATGKDPTASTKLNNSLSYSTAEPTAGLPTVPTNKEYLRQILSQYSIPPTNTSATLPVFQLSHTPSTDPKQVPLTEELVLSMTGA